MLRPEVCKTVFLKELKELLRDRRSLLIMFGVPLLVYPLLIAGVTSIAASKMQSDKVRDAAIAVQNLADAPELERRLRLPENHLKLLEQEGTTADLQSGAIDASLTIPEDAEKNLLSPETAASPTTQPAFTLKVNKSRGDSDSTEDRIQAILNGYQKWLTEQRLTQRNIPLTVLSPLERNVIDIATQDQRLGRLLAQLLPVLLLVTGMLGAFFPALNATTTERELGTLETLLVTPVNRTELLFSKGLLVLCCSILTSGLNMASMSLVFLRVASLAGEKLGTLSLDPTLIFLAFLATIPSLIFFSAAVMCVGMIARTYREANSFAAPVMMLPMAAMAVGMADPATTKALLATPVANTTLLIRDILTHRATFSNFLIAAGSNLVFAFALISIAARLFTNEQLVNPAWEPISLKGFKRSGGVKKWRWPTVDEALILTALTVLIQFYAGPSLGKLYTSGKLNAPLLVLVLQLISFILPAILFALLGRYPLKRVFALSLPKSLAAPSAILLGFSLAFLSVAWGRIQDFFVHTAPSDSQQTVVQLIGESLAISPIIAVLFFGVVPGICEELLFRGIVLSALRKTFARGTPALNPALTHTQHQNLHLRPAHRRLDHRLPLRPHPPRHRRPPHPHAPRRPPRLHHPLHRLSPSRRLSPRRLQRHSGWHRRLLRQSLRQRGRRHHPPRRLRPRIPSPLLPLLLAPHRRRSPPRPPRPYPPPQNQKPPSSTQH